MPTSRIEAFSDGVFAIAITLLVLGVAVPDLSREELVRGELLAHLIALWPKLISYAISFSVIGIFWVGHHIMFQYIKRSDRTLLWLNTLLLMVVSFIPFPAALIGAYSDERIAVVVYGGTLALAGIVFESIWLYASGGRRLVDKNLDPHLIRKASKIVLAAPAVYLIAIALAFVDLHLSLAIYLLVPILYVLPGPIDDLVDAGNSGQGNFR